MRAIALTLLLVAGGQSDYEIVIGDQATRVSRTAAGELQTWIEAATGVQLPVVAEASPDRKHLYVGPGAAPADWGIAVEDIAPEGFVIMTMGDDMAFVGADRGIHPEKITNTAAPTWCGTMNAVYDFLEEQVGVRWYWHDDLGTIVPQLDELKVPALNYTEEPDFVYRALPYGPNDAEGGQVASGEWGRRNRLGKSISTYHAHAWFQAVPIDQYAEEHPEYYALVNGERVTRHYSGHHGGQLCTTNPDVIEIFAEWCKNYFRTHPDRDMCSLSPNDGGGFCECENCTALDVAMWPEDGSRAGHPEMADRMLTFYNAIAEKVVEEFPDRYLGAYVYSYYQAPPHRLKAHPNLALVLAPNTGWTGSAPANWERDREQMDGWAAVHGNMFMYDIFYRTTGARNHIAPVVDHIATYLRHMKQIGMSGGYLYIGPNWEVMGPGAYLMAKLMWETDADAEAIVSRWYGDLYGPAGSNVRELYELVEERWAAALSREGMPELKQAAYFTEKGGSPAAIGRVLDCWQPIMPEALALVDAAANAAQTDEQKARVARVADQMQFTRASVEALMAIADFETTRDPSPAISARVKAGIEAREAALERIATDWSPHFRDVVRGTDDHIQSPLRPNAAYFTLAGDASRSKLYAQSVEEPPVVDGLADDAAWQGAQVGKFRENHGANEAKVSTSSAITYDADALYVLFRCDEPNMDKLKLESFDRDNSQLFATDSVEMLIDPDGDGLNYYQFAVNAGGSIYDGFSANAEEHDAAWDGEWQSALNISETGWAVEVRIPLATLEQDGIAEGDQWSVNLYRTRRATAGAKSEYQALSPTLGGYHQPDKFAELHFGRPPAGASGENVLAPWAFEKFELGEAGTEKLRVGGEGEFAAEIADDNVYGDEGRALKLTVPEGGHASFTYYPSTIAAGGYRFTMRYYTDSLQPADPGGTASAPVTRVIFRDKEGKAVCESKLYSWERGSAEAADGKWADHTHAFGTLPGTDRVSVTIFIHRPGTWWVDDVSLTALQ